MNKEFRVHTLNENGRQKAFAIAEAFDDLLNTLQTNFGQPLCPPGRELSIVKTKLEEACFFAKKAMASDLANCEEDK